MRDSYTLTCKLWCERLYARKDEAIALVGEPNYRMWIAYLAGVSLSFTRGSILIYQALASHARESKALPPTRADLYEDRKT